MSAKWVVRALPPQCAADCSADLDLVSSSLVQACAVADDTRVRYWLRQLTTHVGSHRQTVPGPQARVLWDLLWCYVIDGNTERRAFTVALGAESLALLARSLRDARVMPVVPWRPLYQLWSAAEFPPSQRAALPSVDAPRVASALRGLIEKTRSFFAPQAEAELLALFLPGLSYPAHNECQRCLGCLSLLLPSKHGRYRAWLPQVLERWALIPNDTPWANRMMTLLAHVAKHDATFELPAALREQIFSNVLQQLEVTTGSTTKLSSLPLTLEQGGVYSNVGDLGGVVTSFAHVVAWCLRPVDDDPLFTQLTTLVHTLSSYFHPSNSGRWTPGLGAFLATLTRTLCHRWGREQKPARSAESALQLGAHHRQRVVELLLPQVLMAMWSKSDDLRRSACEALKHMGYLAPQVVFPPLLERVVYALETVTATHQTSAALEICATVAHPLLSRTNFAEGARFLPQLLQLSLPGIDPNDYAKTKSTLKFYFSALQWVSLVDESSSTNVMASSEEDAAAKSATGFFGDWVVQLWNQLCVYWQFLGKDDERVADLSSIQLPFAMALVAHMSGPLRKHFVTNHLLPYVASERSININAVEEVGLFLASASLCDPAGAGATLADTLLGMLGSSPKTCAKNVALWSLSLLSFIKCTWQLDRLRATVEQVLWHDDREVRLAACALIGSAVSSLALTSLHPVAWTAHPAHHWQSWGAHADRELLLSETLWDIPSAQARASAAALLNHFAAFADAELLRCRSAGVLTEADVDRIGNVIVSLCAVALPHDMAADPTLTDPTRVARDAERGFPAYVQLASPPVDVPLEGVEGVRMRLYHLAQQLYELVRQLRPEAASLAPTVAQCLEVVICPSASVIWMYERARKQWRQKIANVAARERQSRYMLLWKADNHLVHLRALHQSVVRDTAATRNVLGCLFDMATSEYSVARKSAQESLAAIATKLPLFVDQELVPRALALFSEATTAPHAIKGALYLLRHPLVLRKLGSKPKWMRAFFQALFRSAALEKTTLQVLVTSVFAAFTSMLSADPFAVAHGDQVLPAARDHWAHHNAQVAATVQHIQDDLLLVGNAQAALHWRYELILCMCFGSLFRRGTPVSPPVAQWFAKRVCSDVPLVRQAARAALGLVVRLELPKRPREWVTHTDGIGGVDGEWFDRPWEGFAASLPFMHKRYTALASTPTSPALSTVNQVLLRDGFLTLCIKAQVLDHAKDEASQRGGGGGGGGTPNYAQLSQMMRHYADRIPASIMRSMEAMVGGGDGASAFLSTALAAPLGTLSKRWPLSYHTASSGMFSREGALFWKALFKAFGPAMVTSDLKAEVVRCAQASATREEQCVAMEIVAGLARGMKHWDVATSQLEWSAWLVPLLRDVLPQAPPDSSFDWVTCLRFATYHRDPRRFEALVELVLGLPAANQHVSSALSKSLRYVCALMMELDWRAADAWPAVVASLVPLLSNDYKQTRIEVANTLFNACCMGGGVPQAELSALFQAAVSAAGNERVADTLLTFLARALAAQRHLSVPVLLKRLPDLMDVMLNTHQSADKEVATLARAVTPTMALVTFFWTPEARAVLNSMLGRLALHAESHASWHVRAALPLMLTLLDFNHRFVVHAPTLPAIERGLCDVHVEVRAVSELALRSILTGSTDEAVVRAVVDKYARLCRGAAPARKRAAAAAAAAPAADAAASMAQLHSGLLGLSAVVLAAPYSVPAWVPDALKIVAELVSAPAPAGPAAAATMAEWFRTHGDSWEEEHEHKFTQDQLQVIRHNTSTASYFA